MTNTLYSMKYEHMGIGSGVCVRLKMNAFDDKTLLFHQNNKNTSFIGEISEVNVLLKIESFGVK